jgi:hypothetical protein
VTLAVFIYGRIQSVRQQRVRREKLKTKFPSSRFSRKVEKDKAEVGEKMGPEEDLSDEGRISVRFKY